MLRFTVVIEPETFQYLPHEIQEQITNKLPQKVERESERLRYERMRLDYEEAANQNWKDILNKSLRD